MTTILKPIALNERSYNVVVLHQALAALGLPVSANETMFAPEKMCDITCFSELRKWNTESPTLKRCAATPDRIVEARAIITLSAGQICEICDRRAHQVALPHRRAATAGHERHRLR